MASCREPGGECPIGLPLHPRASRVLEIAEALGNLKHLHIQDSICRAYEVDVMDLRLLATLVTTLKELQPKKADAEQQEGV